MASLAVRNGVLGKRLAAHLLRRATYHITPDRINQFANMTASAAVDNLLAPTPMREPNGPISWETGNPIYELDDARGGEAVELAGLGTNAHILWRLYESMYDQGATWKIVNWFASIYSVYNSTYYNYPFWRLLHLMVHSDLKTLATKVTLDCNMTLYLNNQQNRGGNENENYAREFLELFSIQKGEVVAVGNYTNYTEGDISLAAQVFSGYRIHNTNVDTDTGIIRAFPYISLHNTANKTFSDAFADPAKPNIHVITGATTVGDMDREISDFMEMVFNQLETARAYVRKMYRYFVSDNLNAEIEADIIEPLAIQMKGANNDYDHIAVLKTLLKSVHFYDEDDDDSTNEIIGAKIKSPYELFYHSVNLLKIPLPDATDNYRLYRTNFHSIVNEHVNYLGLQMRGPLTVEGYSGFYDAPSYSKNWFSANFIYRRFTYGLSIKRGRIRNSNSYFPFSVDVVSYIKDNFDDPAGPGLPQSPIGVADAYKVINEMLEYFLPEMPVGDRYLYFADALLGGLSPINWYFSWVEYLNTDDDTNVRVGLESLYDAVLSSPEFQIF